MTPKEGFKYGFLLRCAEEGLTVKEAEARATRVLEKRGGAVDQVIGDIYSGVKNLFTGTPKFIGEWGPKVLGAGAVGAAGLGAGAGYGLAKLQEGDIDPEEVQREELIAAYRSQAELARRKAIMAAAQRSWSRPKSFHGI